MLEFSNHLMLLCVQEQHASNKVFPHSSTSNRQFAVVNPRMERIWDVPNRGRELMQYMLRVG